jgi:hypothetical protein
MSINNAKSYQEILNYKESKEEELSKRYTLTLLSVAV